MRAIILAAGEGKRLRPYTLDCPKCLVELAGAPLLVHQVEILNSTGIEDITVVTGYRGQQVADWGYRTLHNPDYAYTGLVTSLMCADTLLDGGDDVLIVHGDIVFERRILDALRACSDPVCCTIDTSWLRLWRLRTGSPLSCADKMKLDDEGNILELGKHPGSYDDIEGQYMGLIKIRADYAPDVTTLYWRLDIGKLYDSRDLPNMHMTSFLQHLIDNGLDIRAIPVDGGWLKVESASDLELYNRLYDEGRLDEYYQVSLTSRCQRR